MLEVRYVYSKQACAQNLTPKKIKAVPNASTEIVNKSNYKLNKLGFDHWKSLYSKLMEKWFYHNDNAMHSYYN